MKKSIWLCVVLCALQVSIQAQNWQPIAKGNPYFFKGDTTSLTMGIEVRSQRSENGVDIYRFNNGLPDKPYDKFDIGVDYDDSDDSIFYKPTLIGAEMHVHANGNVFLRDTAQGIKLLLKPWEPLGAEWTFDSIKSIKATVSKVYEGLARDSIDSLKQISLSNGRRLILSKNHGIVYTPNLFPYNSKYVVDYKQVNDNRLTQRQMNDFNVGDVIHTYVNQGWSGSFNRLDTVLLKQVSSDSMSVTYWVKRVENYRTAYKLTWNLDYRDSFFSPHLPGELYYTQTPYMPVRGYYFYDSTSKFGVPYHHHVREWYWSPRFTQQLAGIGHLFYSVPESEPRDKYISLAYYKKGTTTWGQPLFVGSVEPPIDRAISIYPNPAQGQLLVSGLEQTQAARIVDVSGKVLQDLQLRNGTLDISALAPGSYVLALDNGQNIFFSVL